MEVRLYYQIALGRLSVYSTKSEHILLNNYIPGSKDVFEQRIRELEVLKKDPESVISKYLGWDEHAYLGRVAYIGGNVATGRLYKDGEIYLVNNLSEKPDFLKLTIDELIGVFTRAKRFYDLYESEESFSSYPNLAALLDEKYADYFIKLGFIPVTNSPNQVYYTHDWLSIDIIEDMDGIGTFFVNTKINQRYEFYFALEMLHWEDANIFAMMCQKYSQKLPADEARTAILALTMKYMENHFGGILKKKDYDYFNKLEEERILRKEMLNKVFLLENNNPIRQLFLENNPIWWEEMREELKKKESQPEILMTNNTRNEGIQNSTKSVDVFNEALEKNELFDLFTGQKEYYKANQYADAPMNSIYIFELIEKKYKEDSRILNVVFKTILQISQDPTYSWFAMYYISKMILLKDRNKIQTDFSGYLQEIVENISKHKSKLIHEKRWGGHLWENGLWGDVQRMVNNINDSYGYHLVLKENLD